MLSDLLGAAAAGLRNLLIITGDPPKMGPYPDATAVFDIDAIGLTNLVSRLNHGLDPGGNPIGAPTRFVIGVGRQSRGARPRARALAARLEGRRRGGVRGDAAGLRPRSARPVPRPHRPARTADHRRHLAAGVAPQRRVPGQRSAGHHGARTRSWSGCARPARWARKGLAEGVRIAREMLAAVRGRVQGVQIAAPLGRVPVALEVLGPR